MVVPPPPSASDVAESATTNAPAITITVIIANTGIFFISVIGFTLSFRSLLYLLYRI